MATTTEETPAEPRVQPKIAAILEVLAPNGPLDKAAKKSSEALTETGKIFQRIEKDMHGNRAAVSFIRRLDKMSPDKLADFIRTAEPLMVEKGYTLDAIDPQELPIVAPAAPAAPPPASDAAANQAPPPPAVDPGNNAQLSGLDAARARLGDGDGDAASRQRASDKNGSVQLRKLIGAIRAGRSVEESSELSGVPLEEAKDHAAAEERGEYVELDVIAPAPKRGRARLGIVPSGEAAAK